MIAQDNMSCARVTAAGAGTTSAVCTHKLLATCQRSELSTAARLQRGAAGAHGDCRGGRDAARSRGADRPARDGPQRARSRRRRVLCLVQARIHPPHRPLHCAAGKRLRIARDAAGGRLSAIDLRGPGQQALATDRAHA